MKRFVTKDGKEHELECKETYAVFGAVSASTRSRWHFICGSSTRNALGFADAVQRAITSFGAAQIDIIKGLDIRG